MAIAEVGVLEEQKRHLAPTDPRFLILTADVRRASDRLAMVVAICEELAVEIDRDTMAAELASIAKTPPDAPLVAILDEWRAAERALSESEPGSPAAAELIARFRHLRAAYAVAASAVVSELGTI